MNSCVKRLRFVQSHTTKYAPASRCAPNIAKAAHLSGFHFALARPLLSLLSRKHIRSVLDSHVNLFGVELDSHVNLFEDGLTRRSAKLAQRAFAPALASRGAFF